MSNDVLEKSSSTRSSFNSNGLKPVEVKVPNQYPTPAQVEGLEPMPDYVAVKRYPAPADACPLN